MDSERKYKVRHVAALNDLTLEQHGSEAAVAAMARAREISAQLEPWRDEDQEAFDEAMADYRRERGDG